MSRLLPVLTSPLLDLPGVRHAFFTRQGGVSEGLYASLNVGAGSKLRISRGLNKLWNQGGIQYAPPIR